MCAARSELHAAGCAREMSLEYHSKMPEADSGAAGWNALLSRKSAGMFTLHLIFAPMRRFARSCAIIA